MSIAVIVVLSIVALIAFDQSYRYGFRQGHRCAQLEARLAQLEAQQFALRA